jgi:hypothetical protein
LLIQIKGQTQCWIDLGEAWKWQLYMSLVSASLFFLPVLIITACYAVIIRTIWKKGAVMSTPKPNSRKNIHPHELESRRASSRGIIPRAKVKTVKMTFVIVFGNDFIQINSYPLWQWTNYRAMTKDFIYYSICDLLVTLHFVWSTTSFR